MQTIDVDDLREPSPFDELYGLELTATAADRVDAVVRVRPDLLQPTGVLHGGVYAAIAEGIASLGTNLTASGEGLVALGMSNQTSFLRPVASGTIRATASRRHCGRTTSVWDVECRDDDDRLCAISRVTLALRPLA